MNDSLPPGTYSGSIAQGIGWFFGYMLVSIVGFFAISFLARQRIAGFDMLFWVFGIAMCIAATVIAVRFATQKLQRTLIGFLIPFAIIGGVGVTFLSACFGGLY